jgi:hypothetical protein
MDVVAKEDYSQKPIDKANESLYAIKTKLEKLNVDIVCIKADLEFIKQSLLQPNKPKTEGWFFS